MILTPSERAAPAAPAIGICRGCNYSLQALPTNRCPECGLPFDPADPRTMNMGKPMGPLVRRLVGPLGWGAAALLGLPMVVLFWLAMYPQSYYGAPLMPLVFACYGLPLVVNPFVLMLFVRALLQGIYNQPAHAGDAKVYRRALVALGIVILLIVLKVPPRVGLLTIVRPLERMRAAIESGTPPATFVGTRLGLYRVERIYTRDDTIAFAVDGSDAGFAHVASGHRPSLTAPDNFGRCFGRWWWYVEE